MSTILPRDDDFQTIPALRFKPDGAHALPVTAAGARNAVPFSPDTRVVSLYCSVPAYLRTGNAAVTATAADHYFPANTYLYASVGDDRQGRHTHVAVLAADGGDGTLHVSELE